MDAVDDEDAFDDDLLLAPESVNPQMHDGIPITGYNRGEPIPDLGRLPQERWREVMRPLGAYTRQLARGSVRTQAETIAAGILIGELISEGRPTGVLAPPSKIPSAPDPPARAASRQVSFRLGPEEHERLSQAARAYGMRPAVLARLLTVRGVNRALHDARREE